MRRITRRSLLLATLALVLTVGSLQPSALLAAVEPDDEVRENAPSARRQAPFDHSMLARTIGAVCSTVSIDRISNSSGRCDVEGFTRQELAPGIAHYRFELTVGPEAYDRIGIHRVVAERTPFRPRKNLDGVFFVHGILFGFEGTFMHRTLDGDLGQPSLLLRLAEEGLDVWGIDLRFSLIPQTTPDPSFMADWDLAQDLRDLDRGLLVARVGRWVSGSGFRPMQLVGFSRGGSIGYAFLNEETRRPSRRRQVRSFIALDTLFVAPDEATRQRQCVSAQRARDRISGGTFGEDFRFLATVGSLATSAPDDPSPLPPFAGFTNRQASLAVGAAPSASGFHFLAGVFDPSGVPTGFRFAPEAPWNRLLLEVSPYQPLAGTLDVLEVGCADESSPYSNRLEDIDVPTLYVGTGGGNGESGVATLERLGSDDTEALIVRLLEPEERPFDIGHLGIFHANSADSLFWDRIVDWLRSH